VHSILRPYHQPAAFATTRACSAEVTAAVQERSSGNNPNSTTTQRTASGEGVHSEQLGAKVGVLGKQAASNLRKGFANLTASARELTTKRGGGSD
jgi:hypothetical protein